MKNQVLDPGGDGETQTWRLGKVRSRTRALDEPGGIDFERVFEGLERIGYNRYVTMHQAFGGVAPPEEAAVRTGEYLKSLVTEA